MEDCVCTKSAVYRLNPDIINYRKQRRMTMYDYLVVGSGLFGAVFAQLILVSDPMNIF